MLSVGQEVDYLTGTWWKPIMYCCINNLVQAQDNNANVIYTRIIHCEIPMVYEKVSMLKNWLMRHKGLHMKWSHIWSLLHWNENTSMQMSFMVDSTQSVTWWLEMMKISRKGFEVLSKGEGQAMAWWPRNLARVKKEVHAFSKGTNQIMLVILKWRIKS